MLLSDAVFHDMNLMTRALQVVESILKELNMVFHAIGQHVQEMMRFHQLHLWIHSYVQN